jgi:probable phosphoglycerate mutase
MKQIPKKMSGELFDQQEAPAARVDGMYTANIDGAARGNPGPASYGVVVRRPDGSPLESLGKYIGRHTNNVAEYYALIAALDYAIARGIKRLRVYSDSQLIVNQMKGLYKVKHPDLRPLHERAKKQAAGLESFTIQYVPREENRAADAAANAALDNTSGMKPAFASESSRAISPSTPNAPRPAIQTARKIRARFSDGVLVPSEPLGYAEDEELEITIERIARTPR